MIAVSKSCGIADSQIRPTIDRSTKEIIGWTDCTEIEYPLFDKSCPLPSDILSGPQMGIAGLTDALQITNGEVSILLWCAVLPSRRKSSRSLASLLAMALASLVGRVPTLVASEKWIRGRLYRRPMRKRAPRRHRIVFLYLR